MNNRNKKIITGLFGLLAASTLMVGCGHKETREEAEARATQVEVIRGEGTGIKTEIGIFGASMFAFDSAELNEEGKAAIEAYRKKLGPELTDAFLVVIVGHTDNTGDLNHNMQLSYNRAESVADYLKATGVDAAKIRTIGRGPEEPIASNDTREGREQNRRVDVAVIAELRALDRVVFPSAIVFERDSADLYEEGKEFLKKNIATTRELMQRATFIEIVGHTDDKWDDDYNMELSKKRAASVRDFLVSQGVDASKMVTTGMGETMPIASNTTRAGRTANRRVEILILGRLNQ
jgi:outer membrane protein OmpA-like peptidoglycan-associated protein